MLLEGDDESIDDGATDPEGPGDLGDREALGGVSKQGENSKPTIKGLRGLLCHVS